MRFINLLSDNLDDLQAASRDPQDIQALTRQTLAIQDDARRLFSNAATSCQYQIISDEFQGVAPQAHVYTSITAS